MRSLLSAWKAGIAALFPVIVVYYVVLWLYNFLAKLEIPFFESIAWSVTEDFHPWLRIFAGSPLFKVVLLFIVVPSLFGTLLKLKWFRHLGSSLLGKLPIFGPLFLILFSDELAVLRKRGPGIPEVVFKRAGDWVPGLVIGEIEAPRAWVEGETITWLVVVSLQSGFTFTNVPAEDVVLTGRSMSEYLVGVTSFGLAFKIDAHAMRRYSDVYGKKE